MPYITSEQRQIFFDRPINNLVPSYNLNPGDMNYIITRLIHNWVKDRGLCYDNLNDAIGVLESAKQEFYRTVVAPYKDKKRKENGSVSELDKEKSDG